MSRLLKRVDLNFDYPSGKVWEGYANPYSKYQNTCKICNGTGYSNKAKYFEDQWYGKEEFDIVAYGSQPYTEDTTEIVVQAKRNCERNPEYYGRGKLAVERETKRLLTHYNKCGRYHLNQQDVDALIADDKLWDFTRVALTEEQKEIVKNKIAAGGNSWLPFSNGYRPTAQEVNIRYLSGMGLDNSAAYSCLKARCAREGVPVECPNCKGSGTYWQFSYQKALYESWVEIEPPKGDGYQLWEDTSEGSPVSPVFESLEELCAWCELNATTFADNKVSASEWHDMLSEGIIYHKEGNNIFI